MSEQMSLWDFDQSKIFERSTQFPSDKKILDAFTVSNVMLIKAARDSEKMFEQKSQQDLLNLIDEFEKTRNENKEYCDELLKDVRLLLDNLQYASSVYTDFKNHLNRFIEGDYYLGDGWYRTKHNSSYKKTKFDNG